ncbi:MAG: arginase [Amaricoccus sp.]|uniref:arginase n=1 Tax=Amaricoccus sp. TaxID=1872485 RepID=UPI00331635F0
MFERLRSTAALAELSQRDIPMLGIGLEIGAAARGTLMGPDALRTTGLPRMLATLGHRVADRGTLREAEAVAVGMEPRWAEFCKHLPEIAGWTRRIHDHAYAMSRDTGVPIFVGGDHSISMGTVSGVARAAAERGREVAVLWLDAHADYNTPETTPSGNLHGMALSFCAGDPILAPILDAERPFRPVAPENIHLFGARSIDPGERARIRTHGIDCVDMRRIDEHGVAVLIAERIAHWRSRDVHLHVSFDIDFLDPGVAPGTGTVVPGGATYREAHLVMEMLCDSGLVGSLDVVELNPYLDDRGRSAVVTAELVASLFGLTILDRVGHERVPATSIPRR